MASLDYDNLSKLLQGLSVTNIPEECKDPSIISNPLKACRTLLTALLVDLVGCSSINAKKSIQFPNNISNGDLSVTLPRLCPDRTPSELSTELVDKFPRDHPVFGRPLPEGVHLRIFLKFETVPRLLLPFILKSHESYGSIASADREKKRLTLEFSSPNITVEFQGKHLRSTVIGGFIGRLYESLGWDVTRINYLGDWGKPIALLYVGWKRFGSEDTYQANPVKHLLDVYHKIEEEFKPERVASRQARDELAKEGKDEGEAQIEIESKGIFAERNEAAKKLEEGDEEVVAFWKRVRTTVVKDYEIFYDRLGLRFDDYSGESEVKNETMVEVEEMLKEKGISEESAGAWMVDMKKLGARAGHAIIRDRNGNSMYLLRDLATVLERSRKFGFDKMIYVVASDNSVHFSQLFKIWEVLNKDMASKLHHAKFSESSKMATTLGKGYRPRDILDQYERAVATLQEADNDKVSLIGKPEQINSNLGISALLVQELSTRSGSAHAFDTAVLSSFQVGSGPHFQYWYSKIRSLLAGVHTSAALTEEDFESLVDDAPADLLRTLAQYPEVVSATSSSLEPSGIVTYLVNVLDLLTDCLDEEEGPMEVTPGLAALLEATRIVMANSMSLLGLVPIADLPQERSDTPVEA